MSRRKNTKESFQKIAIHWTKVGNKELAMAKKTGAKHHYQKARQAFERATRLSVRNLKK
ncbi:MAG: hypothetical protein ACRCST_00175 [Turicibacter sp.]